MTDEKTPRLVLRENDAGEGGNDEGLRPEDDHSIAEFHDPADDVYDSSYEGPVTLVKALTGVNEVQLQQLQHESKTTLGQAGSPSNRSSSPFEFLPAQVVGSPVTRSFNPPSRRALPSLRSSSELRALRDAQAQEEIRVNYLQGVGLELASTRRSADLQPSMNSGEVRVSSMANTSNGKKPSEGFPDTSRAQSPAPHGDVTEDEAQQRDHLRTRRGLRKLKLRKVEPLSSEHHNLKVPAPTEASQDSSTSFRTRRAREGGNWFTGVRASKMLPPGFEPPEGLAESSPPRKSGSLRRPSSRSASLRSRKNRLPPGYAQPHEQPSLIVGYASVPGRGVVGERLHPGHRLTLLSPLDASPDRRVAAPLIPDPDEKVDKCIPAPSGIPRRPPPDLTIDTTLSGALSGSGEVSMRESDFNEVMEDFDGSARPDLPPKSPDRPSDRNGALSSDRGSVVLPVPEPLPEPLAPDAKPKSTGSDRTPRVAATVLVEVWGIALALTVFGVSRVSPLDIQPAACTLEQDQTCTPPSLSFVHKLRLDATLPKALQPYLPLIQPGDIQDLSLTDDGVKVTSRDDVSSLDVRGGMMMTTWLREMNLLSDFRYAGVIGGDASSKKTKETKERFDRLMERPGDSHDGRIAKFANTQGVSRDLSISKDEGSVARLFFALWLACLLAVEMTLLFCSATFMGWQHWPKTDDAVTEEDQSWKQQILTASSLALRIILAGTFGTTAASGILVSFWT